MTAEQLARANPYSKGVRVTNPISVPNKLHPEQPHQYPGTYTLTAQALNRLEKKGLVKRTREVGKRDGKINFNAPIIWTLPKTANLFNPDNRDHEMDCADFFVSLLEAVDFETTSRLEHWDWQWDDSEKEAYSVKNKFFFDRRFVLDGKLYFLEVDRGTKDTNAIRAQFQRYVDFANAFPHERFTVLVTAQGYRSTTTQGRGTFLFNILADLKRSNQFLLALHEHAIADPLGEVWKSPLDPVGFRSFLA